MRQQYLARRGKGYGRRVWTFVLMSLVYHAAVYSVVGALMAWFGEAVPVADLVMMAFPVFMIVTIMHLVRHGPSIREFWRVCPAPARNGAPDSR